MLIARDSARLEQLASELRAAHGVACKVVPADLARDEEIVRVAGVLEAEPDVGVLVNNAGFGSKGKLAEADIARQADMVRLHVMAPMRLSRAVLPAMLERGRGWIINVSSIAGFMHGRGNVNYCATKSYLTRFSQALDTEVYDAGVRVQALCPGFTHSEFHDRLEIDKTTIPRWMWMDAEEVVDRSLRVISRDGPVVYVPGVRNKLLVALISRMPQWVMRRGRATGQREIPRIEAGGCKGPGVGRKRRT
jgi:short-subunit dehydrogenase